MSSTPEPRDAVFTFSYETWTDAVRREMMRPPDRILSTLMSSPRVGRLLVANPPRSAVGAALRAATGQNVTFPSRDDCALYTPLRLARHEPTDVEAVIVGARQYDRNLRRAAEKLHLHAPDVLTTNPIVGAFSGFAWARNVTYFARDDWLTYSGRRDLWESFALAYRQMSVSGTAVIAVSQEIIDRIEPTGPHAVVPNGVQPDEWLGPLPPMPDWLAQIPSPRAVYVGSLDSRLDIDGILDLTRRQPDLSVVLLGPETEAGILDPVRDLPNVHVRSTVGRAELAATLRHADICLLLHVTSPLTQAMSPLKVFEYLAAGAPVIATDLAPVRGLGDRVLLVPTGSDFADVVDRALALGRQDEQARHDFVRGNSWEQRHRVVLDIMMRS